MNYRQYYHLSFRGEADKQIVCCKKVNKGSVYIAQYPVRWTAQSALQFLCRKYDTIGPIGYD